MDYRHRTRAATLQQDRSSSLLGSTSPNEHMMEMGSGMRITSFGDREPSLSPIQHVTPHASALDSSLLSLPLSPKPAQDSFLSRTSRRGLFEDTLDGNDLRQTTREERLRMLHLEARRQHLTHSASFFAEKLMARTDDTNDVYSLAESYYQSQQYERALDLLNKKETLNKSVQCRYLAGLCATALENWRDALDYLGHDNPFADRDFQHERISEGSLKLEAIMCYARGNAYMQLKEIEKAKRCFKEALSVDVRCYDALEALVQYNLLEERAEWEFIITLPYEEQCGQDSDFFRTIYMLRLKRYSHSKDIAMAQKKIEQDYHLGNSLDVMQSIADTLLAESQFESCLKVCQEIRKQDTLYTKCIPTYVACLYELDMKTELYEFSQELVDRLNEEAVTWYAVGMYYLYIKRYPEARRYFSQATSMDQYFEGAWLGYGHAFAAEKDHDQAIAAYMSCSKLIPGSHLPYMYIGMQYMVQEAMDSAYEYLIKSLNKCGNDPFLLNEFGVYYYHLKEYPRALDYLRRSLKLAKGRQSPSSPLWENVWINLGHVYRQSRNYDRALKCFRIALGRNPQNAAAHAAVGMIYHLQRKYGKAIAEYNMALKHSSTQNEIIELLEKALVSHASIPYPDTDVVDDDLDILHIGTSLESINDYVDDELQELAYESQRGEDDDDEPEEDQDDPALYKTRRGSGDAFHIDSQSDDGLLIDEGDLRPSASREWL